MDSLTNKAIGQWLKKRWAWLFAHKTWKQRQEKGWWIQLWAYNATRAAVYAVALVALVFVMWLLFKVAIEAWHTYEKHESDTNLEAFRNLMLGLGALVIGPLGFGLAVIRTVSTWKQARIADQKLQTETFATAIDQLAHDKLPIRLGAIYALEGLAKSSPHLHDSIFEALCAYVRAQRPWLEDRDENDAKTPADIQTILTVIGRRNRDHESRPRIIDLSDTDLRSATFARGHFEGVILLSAHLEMTSLLYVHLEGAFLGLAHLEGADLRGAHLSRTYLDAADLKGVRLQAVSFNAQTTVRNADFRWATSIPHGFRETVAGSDTAQWPADDDEDAWDKAEDAPT